MADCSVIAQEKKACSGKCRSGLCAGLPRVWVVAACEGMVVVFDKTDAQQLRLLPGEGATPVFSLERFVFMITQAEQLRQFEQLVIVGTGSDISWVHSSLPEDVARHIAAEIEYPLLPGWLKHREIDALTKALHSVIF